MMMNPIKFVVALATLSTLGLTVNAAAENVAEHMREHNEAMIAIQRAIIGGSIAGTLEPAQWLLEHAEPAGLPAGSDAFFAAVRTAANDVVEADTIEAAADAASRMGLACGNCHLANNITIVFDEVEQPSDEAAEKPHMQRHQWVADRMWEGLIGPSEEAWNRGANLLFESPIKPHVLAKHGGDDEALVGMSRRVHQLAANATIVSTPEEKAELYGEFIANCGSCHLELGKGATP
jgi:cytochrome c553